METTAKLEQEQLEKGSWQQATRGLARKACATGQAAGNRAAGNRAIGHRDEGIQDAEILAAGDRPHPLGSGHGPERWEGLSELEPALRKLLTRRCGDENDVDDVIQETYLRAARYRNNVDDPRSLRAWTSRIALNVLSDFRRRKRRHQPLPGSEDGADTPLPAALVVEEQDTDLCVGEFLMPSEDARELVSRALSSMREGDRRLLTAFYQDGRDVPHCARHLAIQPHLVKVRLYRARRRMLRRAEHLLALYCPAALVKAALQVSA